MAATKTIISCAVTGAIHTPSMSDALPWRPEDIADQAIRAAEAGAAILHLHARHPETGAPSVDPEHFVPVLDRIGRGTDAVVNITTGGSPYMAVEQRLAAAARFAPEMASLNMGSMNFAFHRMAARRTEWRFDWERDHVLNSETNIFRNTPADIRAVAETLTPHGTRFEHECYDVGHLYTLARGVDDGLFHAPLFVQFVLGVDGGIGAEVDNLVFLIRTADRLLGDAYRFSVLGAGAAQMPMAAVAAQMGGHVRVGLEDSLYIARGRLARSNAEQVTKARGLIEELGHEIATPDEARALLGLKGRDRTAF